MTKLLYKLIYIYITWRLNVKSSNIIFIFRMYSNKSRPTITQYFNENEIYLSLSGLKYVIEYLLNF